MSKTKLDISHAELVALAFSAGRSSAFDEATDAIQLLKKDILSVLPESPAELMAHLKDAPEETMPYIEGFLNLSNELRKIFGAMLKEYDSEQSGQAAVIYRHYPHLKDQKIALAITLDEDDDGAPTLDIQLVIPENEDEMIMMPSSTDAVH